MIVFAGVIVSTLVVFLGTAWVADKRRNYATCTCRKGAVDPTCPRHGTQADASGVEDAQTRKG